MNDDETKRLLDDYRLERGNRDNFGAVVTSISIPQGGKISLAPAGVTAVVGANNCGKSILLRQLEEKLEAPDQYPQPPIVTHIETQLIGNHADALDWFCENTVLSRRVCTDHLTSRPTSNEYSQQRGRF